jgi:hypothetical protein
VGLPLFTPQAITDKLQIAELEQLHTCPNLLQWCFEQFSSLWFGQNSDTFATKCALTIRPVSAMLWAKDRRGIRLGLLQATRYCTGNKPAGSCQASDTGALRGSVPGH